jgi:hypothetical protein
MCGRYQQKNCQTDQWNRIESPEIVPHKYSQLIFDKEAKANGTKTVFSTSSSGTTAHLYAKKKNTSF